MLWCLCPSFFSFLHSCSSFFWDKYWLYLDLALWAANTMSWVMSTLVTPITCRMWSLLILLATNVYSCWFSTTNSLFTEKLIHVKPVHVTTAMSSQPQTTDHAVGQLTAILLQRKVSRQSFSKLKFSNSLLPAVYIKSANYCMILSQTVSFTKLASTQADNKRFITVLQRPGVAAMLWGSKHDSVRATGYLRGGFWTSFLHTAISTDYASGLNPSMSLSLTFFFLTVPKLNDQY